MLTVNNGQIPQSATQKIIYGILGVIQLLAGPYLVVVTSRKLVGKIAGHKIWKIESTELHSFPRTLTHLSEKQVFLTLFFMYKS